MKQTKEDHEAFQRGVGIKLWWSVAALAAQVAAVITRSKKFLLLFVIVLLRPQVLMAAVGVLTGMFLCL